MYLLKQKYDAYEAFTQFKAMVELQFNAKIKCLRFDGGTEYSPIIALLNKQGILHRSSCPYTPQQDGVSERALTYH